MECPACKNLLTEIVQVGVKVLVCQGECGGLWFSHSQVWKLEKLKSGMGTQFLKISRADGVKIFRGVEHICPQCKTTLLFRHFFSKELDTEVDQCAKCAGFWAGVTGLAKIQSIEETQKKKAIDNYFSIILNKKITGIKILNEDVADALKSIFHIFRFLCPEEDFPGAESKFRR